MVVIEIVTSVGVVVSAGTLIAAFWLYRVQKRDEYIRELRRVLIDFRYSLRAINELLKFDLFHDMVSAVVDEKHSQLFLSNLFTYLAEDGEKVDRRKFDKYVGERLLITVPILTDLTEKYKNMLNEMRSSTAFMHEDFPPLYKVIMASIHMFQLVLNDAMRLSRDEDVWKMGLWQVYTQGLSRLGAIQDFQAEFHSLLVSGLQGRLRSKYQLDVDEVIDASDLVLAPFLAKRDSEMWTLRKRMKGMEPSAILVGNPTIRSIANSLREAESGLSWLSEAALLDYREFVAKFEERNFPKEETAE